MFLLRGYEKRYFVIKAKRYRCPHCGRVFREPIEGLKAWQRSSIDLRKHMAARYRQGVCNKNIAKEFKVSESTVERIIHERYEAKVKELREIFPTGLIISPSHEALQDDVPPQNVKALFDEANKLY